jgi:dTDP-glucose 4,6-dehydratase
MVAALVTGGCGFIASNFINSLSGFDEIINVDKMSYCSNIENINKLECQTRYVDICDEEALSKIFKQWDFSVVFHFAAQSHVDNSFEDPVSFTRNNVVGTHVLMEMCRRYAPSAEIIHFSTDEVYGENKTPFGFTEESIMCPTNPYAASKAACDMIVQSYIKSFKMNIKIIRSNNVYGPNQYPEKLIPRTVQLLKQGKKCTVHGLGVVKRSFIHVDDVCEAVRVVWKKGRPGETYNISSDYEYTVIEVVKLIVRHVLNSRDYEAHVEYTMDRPFNDSSYLCESTKLKELGWRQKKGHSELIQFIKELGAL